MSELVITATSRSRAMSRLHLDFSVTLCGCIYLNCVSCVLRDFYLVLPAAAAATVTVAVVAGAVYARRLFSYDFLVSS